MVAITKQNKLDSNDKYLKQLDDIKIRVPKGYKKVIQDLANDEGFRGVNPFFIYLVNKVLKEKGLNEIPGGIKDIKAKEFEE